MLITKQQISIERLFPTKTTLRFSLYDYLSEYYHINDDLLVKGKYYWNYDKLFQNQNVSPLLKIVIKAFNGTIPEEIRNNDSRVYLSIDMIRNSVINSKTEGVDTLIVCYNLIKEKKIKELIQVVKKLDNIFNPIGYFKERRFKDIDLSGNIINQIIRDLYSQKLYEFTPAEIMYLCKLYADLQGVLPVSIDNLIKNNVKVEWKLISKNKSISWTSQILTKFKNQLNWYSLCKNESIDWNVKLLRKVKNHVDWNYISENYNFKNNEFVFLKQEINWALLSNNKNINWTPQLIKKYKTNLHLHNLIKNLNDTPHFEQAFHLCKTKGGFSEAILENYSARMKDVVYKDIFFYHPNYISLNTNIRVENSHHFPYPINDKENGQWREFLSFAPPRPLTKRQIKLWKSSIRHLEEYCYVLKTWYSLGDYGLNHNIVDIVKFIDISIFKDYSGRLRETKVKKANSNDYWDKDKNIRYTLSHFNLDMLSYHAHIKYSFDLLYILDEFWNWDLISLNPMIPFDIKILNEFEDKINWELLSGLDSSFWTEEIIETFSEKWIWGKTVYLDDDNEEKIIGNFYSISTNESIPWTIPLLDKFQDKLDWYQISRNKAIPWSDEILVKFQDKIPIGNEALLSNLSFYNKIVLPRLNESILNTLFDNEIHPSPIYPARCTNPIEEFERRWHCLEYDKYLNVYSLDEELLFGKYEGVKVSEIITRDISYILWLLKNVEDLDFWGDVVELLDDIFYKLSTPVHKIQHYDLSKSHKSGFTHSPRNPVWTEKLSNYYDEYSEDDSE